MLFVQVFNYCSIRRPCCCSSSQTVLRGVQAATHDKMLAVNVSANIHMFTFVCVISTIMRFHVHKLTRLRFNICKGDTTGNIFVVTKTAFL